MAKKNKKISLSNQEASKALKMLSFAAVALALGLVASNYFMTSLNFHRQVFSKKNAVENQLQANAEALDVLEADFARLERTGPRSDDVFAVLPTSKDFPLTSATIESIANRSGALIVNISVSTADELIVGEDAYAESDPTVQEMIITVEANGSYRVIRDMINNLERSRRVFRVEAIELTGSSSNLNALMSIKTFYLPAVDNKIEEETFTL